MATAVRNSDNNTRPAGLFVTGTDTDAGKTVLAAALTAAMRASGRQVRAHKPAITGLDGPPGQWPADHVLLASLCGLTAEEVAPLRYGPAVSPHLAARLANAPVNPADILAAARLAASTAAAENAALVVEGIGGLLVPLTDDLSVRGLAADLRLPLLIAARPGLGTINHTLLTIEAARAANLDLRAVVLTPWPTEPSAIERSNRETIERLGEIEVATLPHVAEPSFVALATAGESLPWRRWLD